jgi:hypothetical protein
LGQIAFADRITNAYSNIKKGDFPKAKALLDKQLEKEPQNAGAFHVLAYYFFEEKNPDYYLDSAYFFVQKALAEYPKANPKDTKDWAKEGISPETAQQLKANIEAKAFANAQKANTVLAYQDFIKRFAKAKETEKATLLLYDVAWEDAQKLNTLADYQAFMNNYPKAKYIPEATRRRDRFVYERETQTGKKSAYEQFLSKYPRNTFVNEAIEKLFPLATAHNSPEAFSSFIQKYPAHSLIPLAWDRLRGLYADKPISDFLRDFPQYYQADYLRKLQEVADLQYFPILESDAYGYLDERGKVQIQPEWENIIPKHLCKTTTEAYIITQQNAHLGLLDKLGKTILKPEFDKIELLLYGLIRVSKNANQGIYSSTGKEILPIRYDGIEILNQSLLKIKKNRRWGIATHNGLTAIEPRYLEIESKGDNLLILRSSGEDFSLQSTQAILQFITEKITPSESRFEGFEAISPEFFKIRQNQKTGVLNTKLQPILPTEFTGIAWIERLGFLARKDSLIYIYDLNGNPLTTNGYQKVSNSQHFFGARQGKKWGLLDSKGTLLKAFEYDSLAFIGEVVFLWKGKKVSSEFPLHPQVKPIDFTSFKNIRAEKGDYPHAEAFIYYENALMQKGLFGQNGTKICPPQYQSIYPLGNDLLNVQQNGKYGLVDSTGKTVLTVKYDGITNIEGNYKALILANKFGIYNRHRVILIEPSFDALPKLFGNPIKNPLFVGQRKGQTGVVDKQNKVIIPFEFQEILPYQDSIAIALNKKNEWIFYSFAKSTPAKERIKKTDFEEIRLLLSTEDEHLLQVKANSKYGLWHSRKGEIIRPEFEHINNLGTIERPFYFAERREGNRYIINFINQQGEVIRNKNLSEDEYYRMICEE